MMNSIDQAKKLSHFIALDELNLMSWFNAIRKDQTEFRQGLDVLSLSKDGVLKAAPLFEKNRRGFRRVS